MIDTNKCLIVPPGIKGGQPIIIDLEQILWAEKRQDEVATVNSSKAPELLATFNKQWLDLSRLVAQLTAERNKAEKELGKRRSVILLDLMNEKLAAKGVSSSADNREAVILLDEEYIQLSDTLDQLVAILETMKGKMKSFDNAFTSVKRLVVQDSYMQYNKNNSLSGDTYTYSPPKSNQTQSNTTKTTRAGFGQAKLYKD
jgi:hypothetical protein